MYSQIDKTCIFHAAYALRLINFEMPWPTRHVLACVHKTYMLHVIYAIRLMLLMLDAVNDKEHASARSRRTLRTCSRINAQASTMIRAPAHKHIAERKHTHASFNFITHICLLVLLHTCTHARISEREHNSTCLKDYYTHMAHTLTHKHQAHTHTHTHLSPLLKITMSTHAHPRP